MIKNSRTSDVLSFGMADPEIVLPQMSHVSAELQALCAKQSFQSNKQSFQSNKTHRKLCEVLTTYQSLYYQKTLKKKV